VTLLNAGPDQPALTGSAIDHECEPVVPRVHDPERIREPLPALDIEQWQRAGEIGGILGRIDGSRRQTHVSPSQGSRKTSTLQHSFRESHPHV
jgi:hypothetical protein